MKIMIRALLLLICGILLQLPAFAQLQLPQASPKAKVSQIVGLTEVTVDYHAPGVKGRKIWGEIVPYNELWRAGANEATTVSFEDDVTVNGERVPAGKYSLFTVPLNDSSWYVILNTDTALWGTENYDELNDVVRSKVQPQKAPFQETLVYSFNNIKTGSADLILAWENIRIPMHIETDVRAKAMANMKKAIEKATSDDWLLFAQCANYLVQNNIQHEQALLWINKSLEIQETFYNNWVKAQLLAQKNEYQLAIEYTKKAMKLGESDSDVYKTYASQIENSYNLWRKKRF
ncbi:MAG: DUF2911 domain-containing protein [Hymenobacteraceae bacterium]|nr:DUF2911 domain-containing protein [Hymenobacteraceae bacterium]MDX5397178.1 DUF2911 domain-containing protein [Hymenobacteraceae bacterium]MDX5442461.1 DUF2911 domain-containing protein [Hymenobacteraceae bacterium]MDX5513254.1 DUF2911 domain-containing protein [Hymenobacteraceae bacterium]